ncbi:MAG: response regulator transcription factor [Ruminococcaceae bacterium]|nr:response regulator transcription factor [Oscillospiraceae bacterium]
MKIVVCDDDRVFADKLIRDMQSIIARNESFCDMIIRCEYIYPPEALLSYAENTYIDILFLDISMPEIDGMKIAQSFYDLHPETLIIFITNYKEYVFYSLRFNPFRYLRKTNLNDELEEALTSAVKNLLSSDKYITLINRNDCTQISVHRVIYIEKQKATNYIKILCINEEYRDRRGIKELIADLDPSLFIRINVGTVINIKHIHSIREDHVVMSNKECLPIAKKYYTELKTKYIKFMRERERFSE